MTMPPTREWLENEIERLRAARMMLENKSFRISIREDQRRIDAKLADCRRKLEELTG